MPLTTNIGKFATYDSSFLDDQVVGLAMLVEPKITTLWDLIPEIGAGARMSEKIKWYDAKTNSLEGAVRTGGWLATGTTGLVVDAALAAVVNIGDVLEVGTEQVVVSAVVRTGGSETIDVFARGHGGTTAATHAASDVIYIIGNANVEGTVDGVSILEDNVERVNYFQLIEEVVELTKTSKNQTYEDVQDKMNEVRVRAMSRAFRKLNMTSLFGTPDAGSKVLPRSCGGVRHFIQNDADNINTNAAASFTETVLKDTLLEIAKRGGTPNLIICSPEKKSQINGFNASNTRLTRDERTAGNIVDFYEGEGVGRLGVIADPLLRDSFGEMYVLNTQKMGKMWFPEDSLRFEAETSNSRTIKETLQGQFSLKLKDAATDFARIHNM